MAAKLVLTFTLASGEESKLTFNHADKNVENTDVKALMTAIVANGSIYKSVPVAPKAAKVVVTTETDIDLDA